MSEKSRLVGQDDWLAAVAEALRGSFPQGMDKVRVVAFIANFIDQTSILEAPAEAARRLADPHWREKPARYWCFGDPNLLTDWVPPGSTAIRVDVAHLGEEWIFLEEGWVPKY